MENQPNSGELKIAEYVSRIQTGESKDAILQGLPQLWIDKINEQLDTFQPESVSKEERLRKLSERFDLPNTKTVEDSPNLSLEDRRKLSGWPASYELAKIAKKEGVDLSVLSREEYVNYAIQHSLAIDDDQLRVAPWQRTATSVDEIVTRNKEMRMSIEEESDKAFAKFCFDIQRKAEGDDRTISDGVKVRQGTKDSSSWLFFGINNGTTENSNETFKSYISIKDLNTLTPERFKQFMVALKDAEYNGDIKIFQDMAGQGIRLNDQIVMHGASETDAKLALQTAEIFFGNDIDQKSIGKDEVVDGVNKSYSQILAQRIMDEVRKN